MGSADRDAAVGSSATLSTAVSWLFVPASYPGRFAKAVDSGADVVIIDLEDSVAADAKASARSNLLRSWPGNAAVPMVVRVNATHTAEIVDDLAASASVTRLLFGNIDLALNLGVTDDAALDPSRSDLVRWSAACGFPPPIDGVSTAIRDTGTVSRDAARAKRWGFGGKLCIHPAQVPLVHAAFAPDETELRWAHRVLAVEHDGAATVDGEMIDRPLVDRARRIVRQAR